MSDINIEAVRTLNDYVEYNMSHKNRGFALIFNHENFKNKDHTRRFGTNVDCENLLNTLTNLQFNVKIYTDKTKDEIRVILTDMSTVDHSDNDCILIVIMSHGELDVVFAYDDEYSVDSVTSFFTADRCHSLVGKPKLFFIQACRGDKHVPAVSMDRFIQADSVLEKKFKIPIYADFLYAFSTVEGFLSYRDVLKGSWFLQTLCKQLRDNGSRYDILTLLTIVNRKVSEDFQGISMHSPNQIPSIKSSLTKTLIFRDSNEATANRKKVSLPKQRPYVLVKEIPPEDVNHELSIQLAVAALRIPISEAALTNRKSNKLSNGHKSEEVDAVAVDALANREVNALGDRKVQPMPKQRTYTLAKEISLAYTSHVLELAEASMKRELQK